MVRRVSTNILIPAVDRQQFHFISWAGGGCPGSCLYTLAWFAYVLCGFAFLLCGREQPTTGGLIWKPEHMLRWTGSNNLVTYVLHVVCLGE